MLSILWGIWVISVAIAVPYSSVFSVYHNLKTVILSLLYSPVNRRALRTVRRAYPLCPLFPCGPTIFAEIMGNGLISEMMQRFLLMYLLLHQASNCLS
jgi:hypothetical protein